MKKEFKMRQRVYLATIALMVFSILGLQIKVCEAKEVDQLVYKLNQSDEMSAQQLYLKAVSKKGEVLDIDNAENAYRLLLIKHPDHAISYNLRLASLVAVRAKHVFFPHQKLGYVKDSVNQFAQSERKIIRIKDPELVYELHFYRGMTFINFPSFLGKSEIAETDLVSAASMLTGYNRPSDELVNLFGTLVDIYHKKNPELAKKYEADLQHVTKLSSNKDPRS